MYHFTVIYYCFTELLIILWLLYRCDISTCSDRKTAGCRDAALLGDSFVAVRCCWAWAAWDPSLPFLVMRHRAAHCVGPCTAPPASAWYTRHDRRPVAVVVPSCYAAASRASCVCRHLRRHPHSEACAAVSRKKSNLECIMQKRQRTRCIACKSSTIGLSQERPNHWSSD